LWYSHKMTGPTGPLQNSATELAAYICYRSFSLFSFTNGVLFFLKRQIINSEFHLCNTKMKTENNTVDIARIRIRTGSGHLRFRVAPAIYIS
jgi:hypothetical protein